MGKKNKIQAKLSDQELVPSTLGYFEESKKGFLGLIVLFVIFIGTAVFMPQITEYVNKLLGKSDNDIVEVQPTDNNTDNNETTKEKVVMYELSDTLEFTYNDIKFSNFKTTNINDTNYLNFNLENTSSELVDFGINKYFIETYSSEGTLLERHIFNSTKINSGSTGVQNIILTQDEYANINKIAVSEKSNGDYPDVTLQANSNNEYLLTCSSDTTNIIYTYDKNNKLLKINETIRYTNDNSVTYSNRLSEYQSKVATYNNKDGISSSLVEILTGFTVTTDIEVKNAKIKELNNDNYYSESSEPKVVKFEMESRGFSCR